MNLALFDFDGTLTTEDTFTAFVKAYTPRRRYVKGFFKLSPFVLGYKLGFVSGTIIRQKIVKEAFSNLDMDLLFSYGRKFSAEFIDSVLRHKTYRLFKEHIENGDKVVIVSASLNLYLESWCKKNGVDLICPELEYKDGLSTGNYLYGDCSGPFKASKVKEKYNLNDFDKIYAYGDTDEDLELLELADIKYMRGEQVS